MASIFRVFLLVAFLGAAGGAAFAADERMAERVLGKPDAPVRVDEYVSLTCSHCAVFYTTILPELEKRYVETGKVRFVMHDFPIDGSALKAAAVARCMPRDMYFPFVKILYQNLATWAFGGGNPEANLIQYAKLGGLSEERAKSCIADTALQDAIIAERTEATDKQKIEATPTFVINNGAETIAGAEGVDKFAAVFDRLLAAKKK